MEQLCLSLIGCFPLTWRSTRAVRLACWPRGECIFYLDVRAMHIGPPARQIPHELDEGIVIGAVVSMIYR